MQHHQREWFRPPHNVNGWGWQTEHRLEGMEEHTADLPEIRARLSRLETRLGALSRRSLGDWAVQNRRKLTLYALLALLASWNLSLAEIKETIKLELPFSGGLAGRHLRDAAGGRQAQRHV